MNTRTMLKSGALAALGMCCIAALSGCLPYSTGTGEVGVRTIKGLVGKKGVEDKIYPSGTTYFFVPILTDWHTFNTLTQNLLMTQSATTGEWRGRDDLTFKTIDGNDISLDVVVTYHLIPEKAPYVLQNVASSDEELEANIIRTIARSMPRDIFGELNTEEFYVAETRAEQARVAVERLNQTLEPYGVVVEDVSTKDYRFNPEYQQAIEAKKVADQQVEKNKSMGVAVNEEYLKKVEEAKGEVKKVEATAEGEFQRAKIESDAYYDQQKQLADAILAEGTATAEGLTKMNEALAGAGGEVMVKMAIAEALMNKRIIMMPIGGGGLDVRTTDINSLLQLYGLQNLPRSQQ